jgi:hypothetical protein
VNEEELSQLCAEVEKEVHEAFVQTQLFGIQSCSYEEALEHAAEWSKQYAQFDLDTFRKILERLDTERPL